MINGYSATSVWLSTLSRIMSEGQQVSPRGMKTLELEHNSVSVYMLQPVVYCPARKLSYTFLAAEALWILSGDDRVETIAPYNPNIAKFSDDGHRFFGAYGPRMMGQFDWCVDKLGEDRDTRQSVMTIWREKPGKTKDVPCTVAIIFSIRKGRLHCHVFMRSSDAWLGLPYDIFNFSMLSLKVACAFNLRYGAREPIEPGYLHLTMASSHLYESSFDGAKECLENGGHTTQRYIPSGAYFAGDWEFYEHALLACRDKTDSILTLPWRIRI